MADLELQLTGSGDGGVQGTKPVSNTITFPKELREAIPAHSARVLEFDRIAGTVNRSWAQAPWVASAGYQVTPRVQVQLLAHETGKLHGQFVIGMDLDAETMRALGRFLVDLAERADAEASG